MVNALAIAQGGDTVVVLSAALSAIGNTGNHRGPGLRCALVDGLEKTLCTLVEIGNGRFRPDHDIAPQYRVSSLPQLAQDRAVPTGVPFVFLGYIGLEDGYRQGGFTGPGHPLGRFEYGASAPQGDDHHRVGGAGDGLATAPGQEQAGSGDSADERQAIDAGDRCPARDPGVGVGVAEIEPGEAGKKPVPRPLEQYPQCGEAHQHAAGQGADKAHITPGEQGVQKRQQAAEQRCQAHCQGDAGMTMYVNADIDPGHTSAEQAHTEQPAAPQALPVATATQQISVDGTTQDADWPQLEGRQ